MTNTATVRAGTPRPDIASVDAFKRALVSARSIGYTDPARGGVLKQGLRTADIHEAGAKKVGTEEMGEAVLVALHA